MINEEYDTESLYINLLENSEAFTMYNGSHIWNAIYRENCFSDSEQPVCTEKQMLYNLVSGVHANVNMHISHFYSDLNSDTQYFNPDLYYERVGTQEERLRNMHFSFSFVLRAINRAFTKLSTYNYVGISEEETRHTGELMNEFLNNAHSNCETRSL